MLQYYSLFYVTATRYHCITVYADMLSERQRIKLINITIMELQTVYIKYKRHTQHFSHPQERLWKSQPPLTYENANLLLTL